MMSASTSNNDDYDRMLDLKPPSENLHAIVEESNRQVVELPFVALIGLAAVLPIWSTCVLPLAIVWQIGKFAITQKLPGDGTIPVPKLDSGYVVKDDDIIPRPKRKYDVVIMGATGFTGKLCVRHLVKTYGFNNGTVKWAIAGRSQKKLDQVKNDIIAEFENGNNNAPSKQELFDSIDTIIVDSKVPAMMPNLVRDTRAVVCTVGPFCMYSCHVVEFCAKFGTHYVDISAELDWFRNMMVTWQSTAKKTGARLMTLCGCDSVPWDLTVMRLCDEIKKNDEELVSVTCLDEFVGGISGGTLLTASMMTSGQTFVAPTDDPFVKTIQGSKSMAKTTNDPLSYLVTPVKAPWNDAATSMWKHPFVMAAVNYDAVTWSQALRGAKAPLTYSESCVSPNFVTAMCNGLGLMMGISLLFNPITAYLLKNFVFPKPGTGPDMDEMQHKSFLAVYAKGVGSKGSVYESMMHFPGDAGYLETSRMITEAGLTLALEEDKLPLLKEGGFFTPSVGMGDAFLKRLMKTGTWYGMKKVK